jgi:hypothetical protein
MKAPALVAVDADAAAFAALFAAAVKRRERLGWLELGATVEAPPALAEAAAAGAFKSVVAGDGSVVTVKRVAGRPVLRDLLREHFLGCAAVLVRGHEGRPRLSVAGKKFRFEPLAGRTLDLGADELLDELMRPEHRG